MSIRLDTVPALVGQTDGRQTDTNIAHRMLTGDKKSFYNDDGVIFVYKH